METFFTRAEIAEQLRQESRRQSTGTLIVRTSDGHVVMFVLEKGELISLSAGRARGPAAVAELPRIEGGGCQFNRLQLGHHQPGLPPVEEVAQALEGAAAGSGRSTA